MRRDRVENELRPAERNSRLVACVEPDEEVSQDLAGDFGGEVGGPLREWAGRIGASGDLPGDRQVTQKERFIRQNPLGPAERVGADMQDGTAQNLTVRFCFVRLMSPADDRQARPAKAGKRVGDGVVETPVVTSEVSGTDPAGDGRVERESAVQGWPPKTRGWFYLLVAMRRGRRWGAWTGDCQASLTATSGGRWPSWVSASRPSAR